MSRYQSEPLAGLIAHLQEDDVNYQRVLVQAQSVATDDPFDSEPCTHCGDTSTMVTDSDRPICDGCFEDYDGTDSMWLN